ncbi:MAG TPA: class I SAM-dependent methyltransferase [Gemmataceae bacterium]|nr:class I SAM-dependent methyltransferase [Gemmataceae bacterium]
MWDERYSQPGFAYGSEPNEFLVAAAGRIPEGPVLSLGEGEGRNAAYLAGLGHRVVAIDQSEVGLAKARRLAADRGLVIETVRVDLADYPIESGAWAGIVSIFCHLPRRVRVTLYAAVVRGLRPGGVLVLEAYTPNQLGRGTGGPQDPDMLVSLATLTEELAGLEFVHAQELDRDVREGAYHTGVASVVQIVGRRPPSESGDVPDRGHGNE